MNKHSCIKCKTPYESNDEDAYYCSSCYKESKEIAKQVDVKMLNRPSKREKVSDWQRLEAQGEIRDGNNRIFILKRK